MQNSFFDIANEIKAEKKFIIANVKDPYHYKNEAWVYSLQEFLKDDLLS